MTYRLIALLLLAGGLASGITGVATTAAQPAASASAYAISVVVPGQAGSSAGGAVAFDACRIARYQPETMGVAQPAKLPVVLDRLSLEFSD